LAPSEPHDLSDNGAHSRQHEQGFVMLVVLWVLTSAVILVASFNAAVRGGTTSAVSEIGLSKSEALLDAGVEIAAAHLMDQDEKHQWTGNGTPHELSFGGAEIAIRVRDANGLVDLNKSDEKLLRSLFQAFTGSAPKAARYTDIVMKAREAASGSPRGKEADNVPNAGETSLAGQIAFIDVWQLARTQGIPRELFDQVAPYLTVYSRDGTINPVAAPARVLEAVPNLNRADIERLKYADKSALSDLMQKAQSYLTDESGPAYMVTVSAHRPIDHYSMTRTFAILIDGDPSAPYRLLTKWPLESLPAEKTQ